MSDKVSLRGLDELRLEISALDSQIYKQFTKRMHLVDEVAEHKRQAKTAVYVQEYEAKMAEKIRNFLPADLADHGEVLMRILTRLSRERQYEILLPSDSNWALGRALDKAPRRLPPVQTAVYPGTSQSYSAQAAAALFPAASSIPVRSFASAFRQVVDGNVDAAILPLENSTAGTVGEVYALLEKYPVYIQASCDLQIHHALMALPGVKLGDIRRVVSHPQALGQCSWLIGGMGWEAVEAENTAFAARAVKEEQDPAFAALASPRAAAAQGLDVLLSQASNTRCNQTRFIAVGRDLVLCPEAERVSLLLQTLNEAGALAAMLNIFADLNIDLAKLESRPIPNRPWEYSFWVDFWARPGNGRVRRALYQIEKEAQNVRFLGWYPQLDTSPQSGGLL